MAQISDSLSGGFGRTSLSLFQGAGKAERKKRLGGTELKGPEKRDNADQTALLRLVRQGNSFRRAI